MDATDKKKFAFSEALILFLIPIYGYSLLYAYEYGYFLRLNIPTEFIAVNFSALAKICAFLFLAQVMLIGFLDIIYKLVVHGKGVAIKVLSFFYFFLIAAVLPSIAFDILRPWFLWTSVLVSLYLISEFVFPLIKYKNIKGYWKRVEQQFKADIKHKEEDIVDAIIKRVGYRPFRLAILLISFTYVSFSIGALAAKNQEQFLVIKSDPEVVLLRKYSNNFICSEFDRSKKELLNKISVLTLDRISELGYTISREKVGPLSKKIELRR